MHAPLNDTPCLVGRCCVRETAVAASPPVPCHARYHSEPMYTSQMHQLNSLRVIEQHIAWEAVNCSTEKYNSVDTVKSVTELVPQGPSNLIHRPR